MPQANIRVGEITVTTVSDGELKTGFEVVLNLAAEECARLSGCAPDAAVWLPVNSFVIDIAGKPVLVDAGAGNTMQPTLGKLHANLRAMGIAPESIETILLTHLHGDHAYGLVGDDGEAIYPNATLIMHEEESRFYLERDANERDSERVRRAIPAAKRVTAPYRNRIRKVSDGEVLPGISAVLQPGHTPGHTCWLIESAGDRLLIWGDIVHLPSVQVPRPDTALVYDVNPALAPQTRARVFDWVARERLRVAGAHLPLPGFATIARQDNGYAFAPVP
jgi:glyoxylase-like metal-dependent hydrolase (beta-lactamase superfamily II)